MIRPLFTLYHDQKNRFCAPCYVSSTKFECVFLVPCLRKNSVFLLKKQTLRRCIEKETIPAQLIIRGFVDVHGINAIGFEVIAF